LISDGTIGIFHLHNPSDHVKDLGPTHAVADMSTMIILLGGGS